MAAARDIGSFSGDFCAADARHISCIVHRQRAAGVVTDRRCAKFPPRAMRIVINLQRDPAG